MKFNDTLKNLNLLYLEDDDIIRENINEMLSYFCKNVICVSSIEDAKSILTNDKSINIFLTDINIHDESSLNYIAELRKTNKTLPIIVMSAYTDKNYLLQATKLKLTDYLVKPATFDEIMESLKKAVLDLQDREGFEISINENIYYSSIDTQIYYKDTNELIHLTSKELNLLNLFIANQNRTLSHEEIKNNIWSYDEDASDSAFKNLLNKLRNKIGKDTILNIPKIGYKLNIS